MRIDLSLYLAQSYKDAWSDYQRSLVSSAFPVWDYIVLTASNSHQTEGFRKQLYARKNYVVWGLSMDEKTTNPKWLWKQIKK